MEDWYWYVAGLIILLSVYGIYRHHHPHTDKHDDHHEDHSKGGGWLEIVICFALGLGVIVLVMKGLYPLAITITYITLGYFCWGKEIALAGKVMWMLSIFIGVMLVINYNREKKEGVRATVEAEIHKGYDEEEFVSQHQQKITWWWRLEATPNQPNWSCPNVLCRRWKGRSIVLEVPCAESHGQKPYLRLEWDNLTQKGKATYVGITGTSEGALEMSGRTIPDHLAASETAEITLSGEMELPIAGLNGPKRTFQFQLKPTMSLRSLFQSAIHGANKL